MAVDMQVDLGGLVMKNPVTTASGTFGSGIEYSRFYPLSRLGAVTTKGVSSVPWEGNESPRIAETPSGMLNCIGLQNPGVEAFCAPEGPLEWLQGQQVPIIVNVSGHSIPEYCAVIQRLEETSIDAYELNISCPNVDAGGMAFGTDPELAAQVVRSCRALTSRPLFVKLTPNVTDITLIAKSVEAEGADGLSLINTLLGMSIDIQTRRTRTARPYAGLSGPAVKPIALRMVNQVHKAVSIPLLGMGGICTWEDGVEFLLAGATALAVGTANFMDPLAALKVVEGLENYCREQGIGAVCELTGALED